MSFKPLPAEKVIKLLTKQGFFIARKRGNHVISKHQDGRLVVIPLHKGEELGRGILLRIIKDAKMTKKRIYEINRRVMKKGKEKITNNLSKKQTNQKEKTTTLRALLMTGKSLG